MVISTYGLARRDVDDLAQVPWSDVILDEAQNIKNPQAKQTQAVRSLPAANRIALTGTPVENRLSELWSIMQFLNPGFLGSQAGFRREFALPIERYQDQDATERLQGPGRAVHPAPGQDRSDHHPGPARQAGDEGLLQPDRRAGHALRGGGPRVAGADRSRRRRASSGGAWCWAR